MKIFCRNDHLHKLICFTIFFGLMILFSGCRIWLNIKAKKLGYEGHWDRNYEWVNTPSTVFATKEQYKSYDSAYSDIPEKELLRVQAEQDSMIYMRSCYRFIPNRDSTKFLALFVMPESDPMFEQLGETVHGMTLLTSYDDEDSIEYLGYAVWGILYHNKWYYMRDEHTYIDKSTLNEAQQYFEYRMLCQRCKFFKYYLQENENEFWEMGGEYIFQDNSNGRFEPVEPGLFVDSNGVGLPRAVYKARQDSVLIDHHLNETKKETYVMDQIKFAGIYYDDKVIIYDGDTSRFLIQLLTVDTIGFFIEYYYYDLNVDKLYIWTDEPKKEIEKRHYGDLYVERDINKRTPFKKVGNGDCFPREEIWQLFSADVLKEIIVEK